MVMTLTRQFFAVYIFGLTHLKLLVCHGLNLILLASKDLRVNALACYCVVASRMIELVIVR